MADKWNVRVTTKDGEEVFQALAPFEPTEEQKALWRTATEGEKSITVARIKAVFEWCGEKIRIYAAPDGK